ncbi:sigma-70 family RNA polymerase sigma factor [Paracoccus sp. C2R09]|nr:sigma-70 family RNA polymerase sigma factor [Paracoccus sp. C2R09]
MDTYAPPRHCPLPAIGGILLRSLADEREVALEPQGEWERLLTAANAGDGAAFARFLMQITPVIRGIIRARAVTMGPDEHEDILQEVLLAVHLKRGTWQGDRPVRPWLYAVARHKIVDAFRRRGSAVHVPIETFAETLPEDRSDEPMAARDAAAMLSQIDERSAQIVRAIAIEGENAETAGERVGISAGAARVTMHRAMKRLSSLAERMTK